MGKSKSKTYSISDMSRELGVSVKSISQRLVKLGLNPVERGSNNAKLYSDKAFNVIKEYYQNKEGKTNQNRQLSAKDELIAQLRSENEYLRSQLEQAMTIADQAQKLDLTHTNSRVKKLDQPEKIEEKNHGFWWKLFHD